MSSSEEDEQDNVILSFPGKHKKGLDTGPMGQDFGDRLAGWIASLVALLLIFGLGTAFSLFVVVPWIEELEDKDDGGVQVLWGILAVQICLWVLGVWSYAAAMWTRNFVSPAPPAAPSSRYCRYCRAAKPIRAHHCSTCNRCVLKMDHHCPWINNCVGFRNHGYYLRFLFYTMAVMLLGLIVLVARMISLRGRWSYPIGGPLGLETVELLSIIITIVAFSVLVLMMGGLLAVQLYQAANGYTTIESLEIQRTMRDLGAEKFKFPFDLGRRRNLQLVLGRRIWLWWLPLPLRLNPLTGPHASTAEGEGLVYGTHPDSLMHGQWPLPSREPLIFNSFNASIRHRPASAE